MEPGGGTIIGGGIGAGIGATERAVAGRALGARAGSVAGQGSGRWLDGKLGYGDQGKCAGNCMSADKAPGKPTDKDEYKEPKRWDGKKVTSPGGYGWPDQNGNVWVPTGPDGRPAPHGGSVGTSKALEEATPTSIRAARSVAVKRLFLNSDEC